MLGAVGEDDVAACSIDYWVDVIGAGAGGFGGGRGGVGGAYFPLLLTPQWVEGLTAGRGWIALALVVFASWLPFRLLIGAYLFGAVTILQFHAQGAQINIPQQFMASLPYLATIVVLVAISANRARTKANTPASIGRIFVPDR